MINSCLKNMYFIHIFILRKNHKNGRIIRPTTWSRKQSPDVNMQDLWAEISSPIYCPGLSLGHKLSSKIVGNTLTREPPYLRTIHWPVKTDYLDVFLIQSLKSAERVEDKGVHPDLYLLSSEHYPGSVHC